MAGQADTSRRRQRDRGLWWLLGTTLVAWAGSWRIIYLEVTRWHHMNSRLRFTPPPAPPGAPPPHAGLPVIMALTVAGTAPLLTILATTLLVVKSTARSRRKNRSE
ncbi:hypothetical protein [Amycolatopsis taiwanensis]|uniref:hypothetical protein n=1 Tax=Amycolatopsis taiwanensis TaxID=342230 RepID=UPI000486A6D1|nr:hypothetical protein [Amycolatopsis taiwanensis]